MLCINTRLYRRDRRRRTKRHGRQRRQRRKRRRRHPGGIAERLRGADRYAHGRNGNESWQDHGRGRRARRRHFLRAGGGKRHAHRDALERGERGGGRGVQRAGGENGENRFLYHRCSSGAGIPLARGADDAFRQIPPHGSSQIKISIPHLLGKWGILVCSRARQIPSWRRHCLRICSRGWHKKSPSIGGCAEKEGELHAVGAEPQPYGRSLKISTEAGLCSARCIIFPDNRGTLPHP